MTSLVHVLRDAAQERPDHPAVIHQGHRTSYRVLWHSVRCAAAALRRRGLGPGDRVAVLLPNTTAFPVAYFAVLAIGGTVVPVHLLLSKDEIAYLVRDSGATAVICAPELRDRLGSDAPEVITPEHLDGPGDASAPEERAGDDLAVILYTSGTTGRPKGVMLTHANLRGNIETTVRTPFAVTPDDVLYGCLPLSHIFGQVCGMAVCIRATATLVLAERFAATTALREMTELGCTYLMGVPTMYRELLDAVEAGAPVPPSLNRVYSGGSALPVAMLNEFTARFGCQVYEGYGLTEASPVVAYNLPGRPPVPGTVGHPIPGVEVVIADSSVEEHIAPVAKGEVGEVVVRGPNVTAGYLGLPDETGKAIVDGWLRSGDLGRIDATGRLVLVDRKKEMVIRGGYNIYPREVEEVLARHPAVAQVAVVGVPDARLGEEVCAVIVPRPGAVRDAEAIRGWAKGRLAAYKYPRRVEFVERLPLGTSGKVLKRQLVLDLSARQPTRGSSS
ncbi:long-chain fatty acid--CoA ligase [Streptomyces sp. NPDC126510]|uniref:long-chain-fatty-acid--CoA ligase n=1 Tax=Streptomyces sp. NPDC126510 TaxID=3155317 RepID=UPI00332C0724